MPWRPRPFPTAIRRCPSTTGAPAGAARGRPCAPAGQAAAIRAAVQRPLGMPQIAELVRPGSRVLIAFDDPTTASRGTIRATAIGAVLEELAQAGVADTDIRLVCANALHRKFTRDELAVIIGPELVARFGDRLSCQTPRTAPTSSISA
ncbi:MAG: lactate racemase domain-containing protein [Dehalococcoidia bacterium]